jgi:hypothetical protein
MRDKPKVVRKCIEGGPVLSINQTVSRSAGSWRNPGVRPRRAYSKNQIG